MVVADVMLPGETAPLMSWNRAEAGSGYVQLEVV